jgi:hypothetical protein
MDMRRRDLPARPFASHGVSNGAAGASNGVANGAPRPMVPGSAPARPAAGAPAPRPGVATPASGGSYATAPRPSNKAEDLLQVIRQLTDLLTKENAALKKHRFEDVKTFTERKEQLARLYQGHMNAIHRDPTPLKMLDAARRESLAHQAMRLGELMQDNASLLKANITSINMYFKAVTEAVRDREEKRAAAYSRQGAMNGYIAKRSLAVTFNQTL